MGAPTRDAPGPVSAVSLRVTEALAALALQWALWSHVLLHRHSHVAEVGERSHFGHLRPPRHGYNEVGDKRTVLGWVLVAMAGTQLCDSVDTNVQELELLPGESLRHPLSRFYTRSRAQRSSGSVKVWKLTPSLHRETGAP